MPLIPEKRASRQSSRNAINSQFWEQPVHSAKSIDGLSWSLPCEPPTLDLTGPSGLSRTQQLIASQALRVPFFPSYDASSGGLVSLIHLQCFYHTYLIYIYLTVIIPHVQYTGIRQSSGSHRRQKMVDGHWNPYQSPTHRHSHQTLHHLLHHLLHCKQTTSYQRPLQLFPLC